MDLSFLNMEFIFLVFIGSLTGLFIGAMPGLSVTMGTALLVSLTYTWDTNNAMAVIMGVYTVGVYSGAVTAILLNIPGAPSSVATTLDGYPLAKKGDSRAALKVATIYSFLGTLIGLVILGISARQLSRLALSFRPIDYFLLSLLGLTTVGSLTSDNFIKGLLSALIGVFLSMVGTDPIHGGSRFTLGITNLQRGIPIIPALIGLFGFSEILYQLTLDSSKKEVLKINKETEVEAFKYLKLGSISALIGTIIGALPGAGSPVASLLAYNYAKKNTKKPPVQFGEGAVEGIVASESANNACIGGALIPMLTLGVPGDAVTAVILSAFYVHGLNPGPLLFQETPQMFSIILVAGIIGSFMILLLGFLLTPILSKVIEIKKEHLLPVVALLSIVGAYAGNTSIFDVLLMVTFGFIGFILKRRNFSVAALVLGLVLGGLMDSNFRRTMSLISSSDKPVLELLLSPITLVLFALVLFSILRSIIYYISGKKEG